jgi:lipid II isoglutaminyl synthase (glutamine-hydrolysing)
VKKNNRQNLKKGGSGNRLFNLRLLAAIWTGKVLMLLTRVMGRGGTTLPGRVALKIAPGLPSSLAGQLPEGSVIVTGTNGKTTTSALITGILKEAGYSCVHNQSGSNMSWGVASALLDAASLSSRLPVDYAVMEVDEGAFPGVTGSIQPRAIVVTNIFRDQLDRYGETDLIRDAIRRGLNRQPEGGFQVINADDPSLVSIESISGNPRWTYGLELDLPDDNFENTGRDIKSCPRCSEKLDYDRIYFAHLGHYHCPSCSFARPDPDVKLTDRRTGPDGSTLLKIELPGEEIEVIFPLLGTYNMYNLLAAVTCARALSIPSISIKDALGKALPSFGRMELFDLGDKSMVMALIKNPVGANEVIRTILSQPGRISLLVAINDKIADGTDVSWLWDVDFEQLSFVKDKLITVIVSGLRAWDMAVRFKYAGLDPDQVRVEHDPAAAIRLGLERTCPGGRLFILPTYTAMLEMRRTLNKMGLGKPYWED